MEELGEVRPQRGDAGGRMMGETSGMSRVERLTRAGELLAEALDLLRTTRTHFDARRGDWRTATTPLAGMHAAAGKVMAALHRTARQVNRVPRCWWVEEHEAGGKVRVGPVLESEQNALALRSALLSEHPDTYIDVRFGARAPKRDAGMPVRWRIRRASGTWRGAWSVRRLGSHYVVKVRSADGAWRWCSQVFSCREQALARERELQAGDAARLYHVMTVETEPGRSGWVIERRKGDCWQASGMVFRLDDRGDAVRDLLYRDRFPPDVRVTDFGGDDEAASRSETVRMVTPRWRIQERRSCKGRDVGSDDRHSPWRDVRPSLRRRFSLSDVYALRRNAYLDLVKLKLGTGRADDFRIVRDEAGARESCRA